MAPLRSPAEAAAWLLTPGAIRARAGEFMALAERGELAHFTHHPEKFGAAVDYVLDTIRRNYPSLTIPFHSRWRHFTAGGRDRWASLAHELASLDAHEIARVRFDLAIVSVLLDAGAGGAWRYVEANGGELARSEGLAVASFHMFRSGAFSDSPARPWRADGAALALIDARALAAGLQVRADNPLVGIEGRAALLRRLGETIERTPALFGRPSRIGHLFDHLRHRAANDRLPAQDILHAILLGLGPIWPGRFTLAGVALGDVWRHRLADGDDSAAGFVPFHKLSQWLAYSLIEPLQDSGVTVTDIDALTGLAEYRNGGLMLDAGLLRPRDAGLSRRVLAVGDEPVVEWRALTVALLDRIADEIRRRLNRDAATLPLASVLEGGTWAAGRRLAREKRADGAPPLKIESDGTVF